MKKAAPIALVVFSALSMTACTRDQRTVTGAAIGGAGGSAAGALIAND